MAKNGQKKWAKSGQKVGRNGFRRIFEGKNLGKIAKWPKKVAICPLLKKFLATEKRVNHAKFWTLWPKTHFYFNLIVKKIFFI